jgi:hypothetical protein
MKRTQALGLLAQSARLRIGQKFEVQKFCEGGGAQGGGPSFGPGATPDRHPRISGIARRQQPTRRRLPPQSAGRRPRRCGLRWVAPSVLLGAPAKYGLAKQAAFSGRDARVGAQWEPIRSTIILMACMIFHEHRSSVLRLLRSFVLKRWKFDVPAAEE